MNDADRINQLERQVGDLLRLVDRLLQREASAGGAGGSGAGAGVRKARLTEALDEATDAEASAVLQVWKDGAWTDGQEITLYQDGFRWGIASGKSVRCYKGGGGRWYVLAAERSPFTTVTALCCDETGEETIVCDRVLSIDHEPEDEEDCDCTASQAAGAFGGSGGGIGGGDGPPTVPQSEQTGGGSDGTGSFFSPPLGSL